MQGKIKNKNPQDKELLESIMNDDHNAFRDLFYAYSRSVVNFLTVMTGSHDAAEDISQDIFAYIWENRHKLTTVRNFKSYLFTVARNASFKYLKQDKMLYDFSGEVNEGETHASDEIMMAEETRLLVMIAVNRMPRLRQSVFKMSRYEGLPNDQIAKKLGISNESVASHINAAKNEIRKLITVYLMFFYLLH